MLAVFSGCSDVKFVVNYTPDKIRMVNILMVTRETPGLQSADTAIWEQVRARLKKKKIETFIYRMEAKDSAGFQRILPGLIKKYTPDCILTFFPVNETRLSDEYSSVNYNVELFHQDESGQKAPYFAGSLVILYSDRHRESIMKETGTRIFRAVMGMQRYGCGC
jgi:hypothetical protein